jgi:DNA polymerase elongation subunit (family B)
MYRACDQQGNIDNKIGKRGVILARRDNSKFIRTLYEQLISKIFDGVPRNDILYFILETINKLFSNSIPYKDLVITKAVGDVNNLIPIKEDGKVKIGNYIVKALPTNEKERAEQLHKKNAKDEKDYYEKSLPAQVQLAQKMRRRGQRVDAGSRIEFLITDINNHNDKQYEKIEHIDYFNNHTDVLTIDFFYYLKNSINSIDQLLNVAFAHDISDSYKFILDFMEKQYDFRYKIRRKVLIELKSLFSPKISISK